MKTMMTTRAYTGPKNYQLNQSDRSWRYHFAPSQYLNLVLVTEHSQVQSSTHTNPLTFQPVIPYKRHIRSRQKKLNNKPRGAFSILTFAPIIFGLDQVSTCLLYVFPAQIKSLNSMKLSFRRTIYVFLSIFLVLAPKASPSNMAFMKFFKQMQFPPNVPCDEDHIWWGGIEIKWFQLPCLWIL